ncbi:MAG: hypothetical protein EOM20_09160 [Spartobacteria bacterium]|nr:hypothetical protein [Spartobacteria bacterium]
MNLRKVIILFLIILVGGVGISLYRYSSESESEQVALTWERIQQIAATSRAFYFRMGYWPETLDDLTNRYGKVAFIPAGNTELLIDAWGHPILYEPFDPEYGSGLVISHGKDGRPGGKRLNEDLKVEFSPEKLVGPAGLEPATKGTQSRDIDQAVIRWQQYKETK